MTDTIAAPAKAPARKRSARKTPTIDPARFNELIKNTRLRGIHMISSEFQMRPSYLAAVMKGAEVDIGIDERDAQVEYIDTQSVLSVTASWVVTGSSRDAPESLTASVTYVAVFEIGTGWLRHEVEFFGQRTGVMAIYPYFRQHLNHLSSEAGAEIPLAPVRKAIPVRVRGGFSAAVDAGDDETKSTSD